MRIMVCGRQAAANTATTPQAKSRRCAARGLRKGTVPFSLRENWDSPPLRENWDSPPLRENWDSPPLREGQSPAARKLGQSPYQRAELTGPVARAADGRHDQRQQVARGEIAFGGGGVQGGQAVHDEEDLHEPIPRAGGYSPQAPGPEQGQGPDPIAGGVGQLAREAQHCGGATAPADAGRSVLQVERGRLPVVQAPAGREPIGVGHGAGQGGLRRRRPAQDPGQYGLGPRRAAERQERSPNGGQAQQEADASRGEARPTLAASRMPLKQNQRHAQCPGQHQDLGPSQEGHAHSRSSREEPQRGPCPAVANLPRRAEVLRYGPKRHAKKQQVSRVADAVGPQARDLRQHAEQEAPGRGGPAPDQTHEPEVQRHQRQDQRHGRGHLDAAAPGDGCRSREAFGPAVDGPDPGGEQRLLVFPQECRQEPFALDRLGVSGEAHRVEGRHRGPSDHHELNQPGDRQQPENDRHAADCEGVAWRHSRSPSRRGTQDTRTFARPWRASAKDCRVRTVAVYEDRVNSHSAV